MICPKCGFASANEFGVKDSRALGYAGAGDQGVLGALTPIYRDYGFEAVKRTRLCPSCGEKFLTFELTEKEVDTLLGGRKDLEQRVKEEIGVALLNRLIGEDA